jgi:hypothetical protein
MVNNNNNSNNISNNNQSINQSINHFIHIMKGDTKTQFSDTGIKPEVPRAKAKT